MTTPQTAAHLSPTSNMPLDEISKVSSAEKINAYEGRKSLFFLFGGAYRTTGVMFMVSE